MANSIPATQATAVNTLTTAANDSTKPLDKNDPVIKKIADDYNVNPGPVAEAVNHLRAALKIPDAVGVETAVKEITTALDPKTNGVAGESAGAAAPGNSGNDSSASTYNWGNDAGSNQYTSGGDAGQPVDGGSYASAGNDDAGDVSGSFIPEPPAGIDHAKLDSLRESLKKLGIDPTQIQLIIDQMTKKMEDDLAAQREAWNAAQQRAAQQQAAQQQSAGQAGQNAANDEGNVSLVNGTSQTRMNKVGGAGNAQTGAGTDLMAKQPFIYEGKYADGAIRSNFNRNNVDVGSGTVTFKNGQGGSFVSQTPVGPGTTSFDFSGQTHGNVVAGGVFAFKANQAEYDIGELNVHGDPMTFTVGVHDHAIHQKVFSQDIDMRKLGYTDPSQFKNLHMEAKIEKGLYEVRYQDAAGNMQLVASYHDDGKIYRQMYETPADNTSGGPNEGAKWQANIWSGEDNSSGSGSMQIANLRHVSD